MASSLVDIEKGKLIYNTALALKSDKTASIKVVSIIGKARTGKSTFLNCLLTYWKSDSQHIFTMSDSGTHCTNGIDIYNIKDRGIILLDFQGIYLGDSSNDPKLLLLAYLVSDIIIFNEVKMLSNITLQQFEPMLSFINYLKGKNDLKDFNPKLVFRISDMNLEIDPTSNMQNMLQNEEDQFQAIRECIIDLFDTPYAVCTKNLDRGEFKLLKENNFRALLDNSENGFLEAITSINDYLECCESRRTASLFLTDLPKIVNCINGEKAIDFTKLDIVKSLGDHQIRDWIDALGTDIYSDIVVDGTSETYKNVMKRMETRDRILADIEKIFKSIPKTIRDTRSTNIRQKLDAVIDKANEKNIEQANKLMENIITTHLLKPQFILSHHFENINKIDFDTWCVPFNDKLNAIKKAGEHIHNVALLPFCKWKCDIMATLKEKFMKQLTDVKNLLNKKQNECDKFIKDFENNIESNINDIAKTEALDRPYSIILDKIKTTYNADLTALLQLRRGGGDFCDYWSLVKRFTLKCTKLPFNYNGSCEVEFECVMTSPAAGIRQWNSDFLEMQNKYSARINEILSGSGTDLIAKYRTAEFTKKGFLPNSFSFGGDINCSHSDIINNPNTQFIIFENFRVKHTSNSLHYHITEDYCKLTLEPILVRTCEHLARKDYVYDETVPKLNGWLKFIKDITDIKIPQHGIKVYVISFNFYRNMHKDDYKKLALLEIFENRFKKELCKKASS